MDPEVWANITGWDNYQVSTHGRVRNVATGRVLKLSFNNRGYYKVSLTREGKPRTFMVHRLVADAFLANPEGHPYVDHKDRDQTNNHLGNLRRCSASQNVWNSKKATKKPTSSSYKGVHFDVSHGAWCVQIRKYRSDTKRPQQIIGYYDDELQAAYAYDNAARELQGEFAEFAFLNFPDEHVPEPRKYERKHTNASS